MAGNNNGSSGGKGSSGKEGKSKQKGKQQDVTASATSSPGKAAGSSMDLVLYSVAVVAMIQALFRCCQEAYRIRLYAIEEYGRVIHEFDPYFNYRATEYLWANGWHAFSHWFDYLVRTRAGDSWEQSAVGGTKGWSHHRCGRSVRLSHTRTLLLSQVWYPLGRPVGTTIYPGMQVTSVAIKKFLLPNWSINDICCCE
jgi:dolichyl-diphosphooligosaccharide--protein glycosyltransferase